MSQISILYVITKLEKPEQASGKTYTDYNSPYNADEIFGEDSFQECFGNNAFVEPFEGKEKLSNLNKDFAKILENKTKLEIKQTAENAIIIPKESLTYFQSAKFWELQTIINNSRDKTYNQLKYEIKNILDNQSCHVLEYNKNYKGYIQSIDSWLENNLGNNKETIIQVIQCFEIRD